MTALLDTLSRLFALAMLAVCTTGIVWLAIVITAAHWRARPPRMRKS